MHIDERIALATRLGDYMLGTDEDWQEAQRKAFSENNWFIPEFITASATTIARQFLEHGVLKKLAETYALPAEQTPPKKVGIVLAGNIPLVGFHDVLCTFISGHHALIKPSSKDAALIKHLIEKLLEWNRETEMYLQIADRLNRCDAYIATGGNNTGRYFEYYFGKYPSIIRKNRTSVAVLAGSETSEQLEKLADDVHLYFGLGCRNVTQLYVPNDYDFVPLLDAFKKYSWFINHGKYKNNYDYNLAIHLLNNRYYMTNGSVLLIEDASPTSPISQVHYQYYGDAETSSAQALKKLEAHLANNTALQCVVGKGLQFGTAQCPGLTDFADGVDTMAFLKALNPNQR